MMKYPFVKQVDLKDCASCSLLMIIKYYNGFVPLEKLRDITKTTKLGVNAYNLCEGAKEVGFEAECLKVSIDDLDNKEIFLPLIAHVTINNYGHYVVIYKVNKKKKYLIIGDPASKVKKITFEEFLKMWDGIVINLYPTKTIPMENNISIFNFCIEFIKPLKKILVFIFLLSIIVIIFSCLSSLYFKIIIDSINTSPNYILFIFLIFLTLELINILNSYFRNKLVIFLNQRLDMNMSCNVYDKIIDLPYQYYRNRTTGEIVSRFGDLVLIKDTIVKILISLFTDLPLLLVSIIILFTINIKLSVMLILITTIYLVITIFFNPIINRSVKNLQHRKENYTSLIVESISGFETVKNLNIKKFIKSKFALRFYKYLEEYFKFENLNNAKQILSDLIFGVGIILIIYYSAYQIYDDKFTLGYLMLFYSLSNYFIEAVKNIFNLDMNFKEACNSLKRVVGMFIEYKDEGIVNNFNFKKIKITNLTYSYNNIETILDHINLEINNGEKILITGASGSGKSTLFKIFMKYYQIENNNLFIDDIDYNYFSKKAISNSITYISQNEILFSDTLLNNLNVCNSDKLKEIINLCEINSILDKRKINLNYIVEENGFNFSGGEKQRIILGRALQKDFKILLIDEGLNQMDVNLERRILKRLFSKYSDKTIIIVSHRLNNLDLYDRNMEIKGGKIVKDVKKSE